MLAQAQRIALPNADEVSWIVLDPEVAWNRVTRPQRPILTFEELVSLPAFGTRPALGGNYMTSCSIHLSIIETGMLL
jgi:hypothetical protein